MKISKLLSPFGLSTGVPVFQIKLSLHPVKDLSAKIITCVHIQGYLKMTPQKMQFYSYYAHLFNKCMNEPLCI